MKTLEYKTGKLPIETVEQVFENPIIDIIRHGNTSRKQNRARFHQAPLLNTKHPNFKLNTEHLDLDEKGIAVIEASAHQLAGFIDKENEMVLIMSSPAWRTHSSALVLEKVLREEGVDILNAPNEPKFSKAINQHSYFFQKALEKHFGGEDKSGPILQEYIEKGYKKGLERVLEKHGMDINEKMQEAENLSFKKFLRKMNNIYHWLSPETLAKLKGKRLRIVVLAHEETTRGFVRESLPSDTPFQSEGQILEIISDKARYLNKNET